MLGNILVGAAVVWCLTALVVCPVSRSLLRRRLHSPEFVRTHGGPASESAAAELERLVNRCCISLFWASPNSPAGSSDTGLPVYWIEPETWPTSPCPSGRR
jgi:predicted metal-binding transcription factor (methanogenesis marker protein 9)